MKRFLSLVLTLVMVMSLVTVSAGAKDFTDNDTITYDEAVAVISEIGVVDGYTDGKFNPTNTLTRQAAAKIICNLILGPTTASELHADTAPYRDVPVNHEFAGYIAYCAKEGIISGYADGSFRPGGTLTGYAFMKMLLGALGYDSTLEGYVGGNWSINVAKQAIGIGLNKGLEGEFNGIKAVNREEACLYAFNTLQADLVEYGQRLTTNINGTEVTLSSGGAQSREWKSQQTRINNIIDDEIIQFAEEYFSKLVKAPDDDIFMRPAHTWVYDKKIQIGTWVDQDKLLETYTSGVTGRDLYDLLGSATIRDFDLEIYVDGHVANNTSGTIRTEYTNQYGYDGSDEEFTMADLKRSNTEDLGATDRGVLTEVFIDKDAEIIRVVSIHTWLGQATSSYNESRETATIKVFTGLNAGNVTSATKTVNVEDVPEVADVTGDAFYLVQMSDKDTNLLEVVTLEEPEVLEESTITKFSNGKKDDDTPGYPKNLTTGGTEYKRSNRAFYDADTLDTYNADLLTTNTYNVYMDKYGNFIGIDLFEGNKQYVFVTGYDMRNSNLSVKTAEASGIFLDGTMETMTVNVKDTNKNIDRLVTNRSDGVNDKNTQAYYQQWGTSVSDGVFLLNRWYTYTKTEAGVYTLKPVVDKDGEAMMLAAKTGNDPDADDAELKMNCSKLRLDGVSNSEALLMGETMEYANANSDPAYSLTSMRAYGEDESVFITVDTDDVSGKFGTDGRITKGITDVNGVYTGVQDVDIVTKLSNRVVGDYMKDDTHAAELANEAWQSATDVITNPWNNYIDAGNDNDNKSYLGENAYAVFDKNNFIIGAVILGEAEGNTATKAYILDPVKYERYENGTYYWQFEAVINGEIVTQEAESKFERTIDTMRDNQYEIVELRYKDADSEIVTDVKEIVRDDTAGEDKIYGYPFLEVITNGYNGNADGRKVDGESIYDVVLTGVDGAAYDKGAAADGDVTFEYVHRTRTNSEHSAAYVFEETQMGTLKLQGRTLYFDADQHDYGIDFVRDAKAVVLQEEGVVDANGTVVSSSWEERGYNSVQEAIDSLGDVDNDLSNGRQFRGIITAALNSQGVAEWVVFYSDTLAASRSNTSVTGATMTVIVNVRFAGNDAAERWGTWEAPKPTDGSKIVDIPNPDTINGAPIKAGQHPKLATIPVVWEKGAEGKSVTFEYVADTVTGLRIKSAPAKVTYKAGEAFDPTGMVLEATYDNGDVVEINSGWTLTPDGTGATKDSLAGDTTKVTVGYGGQTVDQAITIDAVNSISVKTQPTQTDYLAGEAFDATGMVVEATYASGDKVDITDTSKLELTIAGGDIDDLANTDTTVTVTYAAKTATVTIDVDDPDVAGDVTGIAVKSGPTKTQYAVEAGVTNKAVDLTGTTITITCNNGRTTDVTTGFTAAPIDVSAAAAAVTVTVTHTANTKQTTFTVAVA